MSYLVGSSAANVIVTRPSWAHVHLRQQIILFLSPFYFTFYGLTAHIKIRCMAWIIGPTIYDLSCHGFTAVKIIALFGFWEIYPTRYNKVQLEDLWRLLHMLAQHMACSIEQIIILITSIPLPFSLSIDVFVAIHVDTQGSTMTWLGSLTGHCGSEHTAVFPERRPHKTMAIYPGAHSHCEAHLRLTLRHSHHFVCPGAASRCFARMHVIRLKTRRSAT